MDKSKLNNQKNSTFYVVKQNIIENVNSKNYLNISLY